jgi:toxin secretion/phage lysis holin
MFPRASIVSVIKQNFNWIAALFGSIFAFTMGTTGNEPVRLALSFIICDFATGLLKGASARNLSSEAAALGLRKKCALILAISFGHFIDMTVGTADAVKGMVSYYVVGAESVSILENLASMGVVLPASVALVLNSMLGKEGLEPMSYPAEDATDGQDETKTPAG